MNPDNHGKAVRWWIGVGHVNIEIQAVLAAHQRPSTKLELRANVTELGRMKQRFEVRWRLRRPPAQVSNRRGRVGYAEVLIFPGRRNALERSLIDDDGTSCDRRSWRARGNRTDGGQPQTNRIDKTIQLPRDLRLLDRVHSFPSLPRFRGAG